MLSEDDLKQIVEAMKPVIAAVVSEMTAPPEAPEATPEAVAPVAPSRSDSEIQQQAILDRRRYGITGGTAVAVTAATFQGGATAGTDSVLAQTLNATGACVVASPLPAATAAGRGFYCATPTTSARK